MCPRDGRQAHRHEARRRHADATGQGEAEGERRRTATTVALSSRPAALVQALAERGTGDVIGAGQFSVAHRHAGLRLDRDQSGRFLRSTWCRLSGTRRARRRCQPRRRLPRCGTRTASSSRWFFLRPADVRALHGCPRGSSRAACWRSTRRSGCSRTRSRPPPRVEPVHGYEVTADGDHFITTKSVAVPSTGPVTRIHLVQNWLQEGQARRREVASNPARARPTRFGLPRDDRIHVVARHPATACATAGSPQEARAADARLRLAEGGIIRIYHIYLEETQMPQLQHGTSRRASPSGSPRAPGRAACRSPAISPTSFAATWISAGPRASSIAWPAAGRARLEARAQGRLRSGSPAGRTRSTPRRRHQAAQRFVDGGSSPALRGHVASEIRVSSVTRAELLYGARPQRVCGREPPPRAHGVLRAAGVRPLPTTRARRIRRNPGVARRRRSVPSGPNAACSSRRRPSAQSTHAGHTQPP